MIRYVFCALAATMILSGAAAADEWTCEVEATAVIG